MRELDELLVPIDDRDKPVTVFFRDDDAGWANERLIELCNRFGASGISLDLAVIPGALDKDAEEALCEVLKKHGPKLHLHQHGHTHTNHQQSGRKCEFGTARSLDDQRTDIAAGRHRLKALFGSLIEPVFTPPWNRCTSVSCQVLAELDFTALSRISGSAELDHRGLADVSVAIDWQKKRDGARLSWPDFCRYATSQFDEHEVVGIMLHHEAMDDAELARFTTFLERLQTSPKAELRTISEIAELKKLEAIHHESVSN